MSAAAPKVSPDFAVQYRDLLVDRIAFDHAATKKCLANIPEAKRGYRPADNSRTAWDLATHIATSDVWFLNGVASHNFEWTGNPPDPANNVADLVAWYDKNMQAALDRVRKMSAAELSQPVSFFGIQNLPAALYLLWAHEHTVHHRGQLTTYLRPMGAKVPDIYGGSFDEPFTGQ